MGITFAKQKLWIAASRKIIVKAVGWLCLIWTEDLQGTQGNGLAGRSEDHDENPKGFEGKQTVYILESYNQVRTKTMCPLLKNSGLCLPCQVIKEISLVCTSKWWKSQALFEHSLHSWTRFVSCLQEYYAGLTITLWRELDWDKLTLIDPKDVL